MKAASAGNQSKFSTGVKSGFGAFRNQAILIALAVIVGLVCGFKLANYGYRQKIAKEAENRANLAATKASTAGASSAPAPAGGAQGQQPNQVMEQITKARQNPNDFDAQRQAAEMFMQIKRPEGALPFLIQANTLKPNDNEVMGELAGAYFFAAKYPDAISWARKALKAKADNRSAKFYLASSLILSEQNLDEASKLLDQVEKDSKDAPEDAKNVIVEMRQRLQKTRTGGSQGEARTSLQHGTTPGGVK